MMEPELLKRVKQVGLTFEPCWHTLHLTKFSVLWTPLDAGTLHELPLMPGLPAGMQQLCTRSSVPAKESRCLMWAVNWPDVLLCRP